MPKSTGFELVDKILFGFVEHLSAIVLIKTCQIYKNVCKIVIESYSKCPLDCGHNLQISLGKTRNTATCMHGLMTSHAAAKDHMTP